MPGCAAHKGFTSMEHYLHLNTFSILIFIFILPSGLQIDLYINYDNFEQ